VPLNTGQIHERESHFREKSTGEALQWHALVNFIDLLFLRFASLLDESLLITRPA
jgi:hypothetical protein